MLSALPQADGQSGSSLRRSRVKLTLRDPANPDAPLKRNCKKLFWFGYPPFLMQLFEVRGRCPYMDTGSQAHLLIGVWGSPHRGRVTVRTSKH